jgi:OOP family OmpA-OmpF porin
MKLSILSLLLCCGYAGHSQGVLPENDSTASNKIAAGIPDSITPTRYKCVFSIGWNIVDNTSTRNNDFLDWNQHYNVVPFLSKISLDRSWNQTISTNVAFTYSRLYKENYQNGETNEILTVDYFALDVLGKLYVDQFFFKSNWLDVHLCAGVGMNYADKDYNKTFNAGAGLDFWIFPRWGLRFQTLGKWAFNQALLANNHIQHSAEVLHRF